MKPFHSILIAAALSLPGAHAATVAVSNLHTETGSAAYKVVTSTGVNAVANSFTTGSGSGWTLDSATVDLFKIPASGSENITAKIYSDSSGLPGSLLATSITLNLTSTGRADRTFDFSGAGLTLNSSTTYWLSLSSDQETTAWSHVSNGETSTTSGLPGWTIGSQLHIDSGSNWNGTVSGGAGLFAINVIPEPSAALLSLAGLGSLLIRRRR